MNNWVLFVAENDDDKRNVSAGKYVPMHVPYAQGLEKDYYV